MPNLYIVEPYFFGNWKIFFLSQDFVNEYNNTAILGMMCIIIKNWFTLWFAKIHIFCESHLQLTGIMQKYDSHDSHDSQDLPCERCKSYDLHNSQYYESYDFKIPNYCESCDLHDSQYFESLHFAWFTIITNLQIILFARFSNHKIGGIYIRMIREP